MERECVEERVCAALSKLLEKDHYLLEKDVNERSITHRLGIYLQEMFPEWHVDCEYNLDGDDPKRLEGFIDKLWREYERFDVALTDQELQQYKEDTTVSPDIIVHKRGTECNLLVIEAKKNHSAERDKIRDCVKLSEYVNQLGYKHALFLKLEVGDDYESLTEVECIQAIQHCR